MRWNDEGRGKIFPVFFAAVVPRDMSTTPEPSLSTRGIKIALIAGVLNAILCCSLGQSLGGVSEGTSTVLETVLVLQLLTQGAITLFSLLKALDAPKKGRIPWIITTVVNLALGCGMIFIVAFAILFSRGIC